MVLEWLLGSKKSLDEVVIGIQKGLTIAFIMVLIFLVLYNAFGDSDNAQRLNDSYLPIVSAWIGIILGFYFSREIADIIGKKLKEEKRDRKKDTEDIVKEYEDFRTETSRIILALLKKASKKKEKNGRKRR